LEQVCGLVPDIAYVAVQLALAAGRHPQLSDSSSGSDVFPVTAPGLLDSPELLALTLLVLHGQLTAAEAGLFATPAQVQQQQQQRPQEEPAHCSHQLFSELLGHAVEDYCCAVHIFLHPLRQLGERVSSSWEAAPCWQQHSSAEDIRHVLLLLLPLLRAWESRNKCDSAAPAAERVQAAEEDRGLDGSLQLLCHLPVLLLQLTIGAWQRSKAALCTAALRTAVAAARCL
jgi:hypothetical protein